MFTFTLQEKINPQVIDIKKSKSISREKIPPEIHHDRTACVKSTAGVVAEGDVASLLNLSVTLGNVQQQPCALRGN